MRYIYELPVYDGALKNWRILNLNTGTFYSMSYPSEAQAGAEIKDGAMRGHQTVKRITREQLINKCEGYDILVSRSPPRNGW